MARGAKRVLGEWTPESEDAGELPWSEVESQIGRAFDEVNRREIFKAPQVYFEALAAYRQGVPLSNIEKLRNRTRDACTELHHIGLVVDESVIDDGSPDSVVTAILGGSGSRADLVEAFHGLTWQYGGDLRSKFCALAKTCHEINLILEKPDGFAVETKSPPEVQAFKDLYAYLAEHAVRWGFTPSHRSPRFVTLTMWIIGFGEDELIDPALRRKVTNQVQNARSEHRRRSKGGK